MSDVLSPNQRRTQAARSTFSEKFDSPEAKSEFYRSIGEKGNAGRVTLAPAKADALRQYAAVLGEAYAFISSLVPKDDQPE